MPFFTFSMKRWVFVLFLNDTFMTLAFFIISFVFEKKSAFSGAIYNILTNPKNSKGDYLKNMLTFKVLNKHTGINSTEICFHFSCRLQMFPKLFCKTVNKSDIILRKWPNLIRNANFIFISKNVRLKMHQYSIRKCKFLKWMIYAK